MRKAKRLLGILLIIMLLVKCTPFDYEGKLPNGYEFYEANSLEIGITLRNLVVFKGNISHMNVKGNLVFGKVDKLPREIQKSRQEIQADENEAPPGYFILDTKTNALQLGLDREKWLNNLSRLGISGEPTLRMPTAFADEPRVITVFKLITFLFVLVFLIILPK